MDAVIVLANLMDSEGNLNSESISRALKAIQVFKEVGASEILTCGWNYRDDCNIVIADAFREFILLNSSISPTHVLTERKSRDTVGDALFTKIDFAIPRKWKHIIVVSSDYHIQRTKEIFNFVYGNGYLIDYVGSESVNIEEKKLNEEASLKAFYRTFEGINAGDTQGIYSCISSKHPFYNGQIYERIPEFQVVE